MLATSGLLSRIQITLVLQLELQFLAYFWADFDLVYRRKSATRRMGRVDQSET